MKTYNGTKNGTIYTEVGKKCRGRLVGKKLENPHCDQIQTKSDVH